jgi:hypothetical protein
MHFVARGTKFGVTVQAECSLGKLLTIRQISKT